MSCNTLTEQQKYYFIVANEGGNRSTVYFDTVGVATLGGGVALITRTGVGSYGIHKQNFAAIAKVLGTDSKEYIDLLDFAQRNADAISGTSTPSNIHKQSEFYQTQRGKAIFNEFGKFTKNFPWEVATSPKLEITESGNITVLAVMERARELDNLLNKYDIGDINETQKLAILDTIYHYGAGSIYVIKALKSIQAGLGDEGLLKALFDPNYLSRYNNTKNLLKSDDSCELTLSIFAPIISENIENGIATGAITISHAYGEDLIVSMYTQDDTANSGSDYVGRAAFDIRIKAGETYGTFDITIRDDKKPEPTEHFYALVESVRTYSGESVDFTLVDLQPFVIEDDDTGDEDTSFAHIVISDPAITEDNTMMRFDIFLTTGPVDKDITIDLATFDASAVGGSDYMGSQGSVTIKAGETSAYYNVMIFKDDDYEEGTETFFLAPTGYKIANNIDANGNEKIRVFFEKAGVGTIIDDGQMATPYDDVLILTDKDDFMDALSGDDYVEGRGGHDTLIGNDGNDILWGGSGNDMLYGNNDNDILYGDIGSDALIGGTGSDLLYGGDGNDVLIGNDGYGGSDTESDQMYGGTGFDTYIAGVGDIIADDDNEGLVVFQGIDLSGEKEKIKDSEVYEDDDFLYMEAGSTLVVTAKDGSGTLMIENWNVETKEALGIKLVENKDIDISITESAVGAEGDSGKRSLYFTVTLSRSLEDEEGLKVYVTNTEEKFYTFTSGEQSHTFTHTWTGDTKDDGAIDHEATLTPSADYLGTYEGVEVTIKNSGKATVYDDDEDNRHDPLALDMDMDGFISTTDLATSGTYFDITGDGLRERVGWISGADALLVYDKNDNGQIDGIDEVFGSTNESGFEELKRTVDSNHDNKIDRRDELFAQLQVWNDANQDAIVQEGELQTLSEAGITSIDLNYVSTNIQINGNLLSDASKYTDTAGNKELAADIQLATDAKDTRVNIEDIPNFTVDPITNLLPQLRGSGLVYDSFIRYNLDPEFKAIAVMMSEDMATVATQFDTFVEHYSGYTAYVNRLREQYSMNTFEMLEADKCAWIVERFEATNTNTVAIEAYYNTNLNSGKIPTEAKTSNPTMELKYRALADRLESTFAMQSVFAEVFSDTHYDLDTQSFIIDDTTAMNAKITGYFNSDTQTIEEKLYLAKVMQMQQGGLDYDIDTLVQSIDNEIVQALVSEIYTTDIKKISNNNYLQQNTFTCASKCDIINNCFYVLNKKAA